MSFMQQQITDKQEWIEIDGNCGRTWVPVDVCLGLAKELKYLEGMTSGEDDLLELADNYYEGEVRSVSLIEGYGARLSAPGYMDCTEWAVFDTEAEAKAYLEETYGDEDEESEKEQ